MQPEVTTLQDIRRARAEACYEHYDFGDGVTVEGAAGWEYPSPGSAMSRKVYVRFDDDAAGDPTHLVSFEVSFADEKSPVVTGAGALLMSNGGEIGTLGVKTLEEKVNDKVASAAAAILDMAPKRRPKP